MALKLYMHPFSTVCRPLLLLIAEKNLPVDQELVDLTKGEHRQPAYAAINPNQAVPALVENDFRMTEGSAILKYLAARFDAPEYPKDLKRRAKVDQMMDWFNTGLYKDFGYGLVYPQIFPHHKRPTADQHAGTIAWGKEKTKRWLSVLDRDILGKDDYVANNQISIADYFGVCLITTGEAIGCTFEGYPNVQRWIANMKKLPSWNKVNQALSGFAGAMAGKTFETV
jgi:glutathione S-transferase